SAESPGRTSRTAVSELTRIADQPLGLGIGATMAATRSTRGGRATYGMASPAVVTTSSKLGLIAPPTVDQTSLARLLSWWATATCTVEFSSAGSLSTGNTWLSMN